MVFYDIYIAGKWMGNVQEKNILDAAAKARLLLQQSNPKIFATKFTLTPRLESVDFDL